MSEIVSINFTSNVPLDIDILLEADAITLFPNPKFGIFSISGPSYSYNINLIDTTGSIVESINYTGNEHDIDISELPLGLLFIEIRNTQNSFICLKKIIKQ